MKKYQRDVAGYKSDQVFKWQQKKEQSQPSSSYSTLEREVRIQDPTTSYAHNKLRWDAYIETARPQYDQRKKGNYGQQTPKKPWKKPFKKPFKKPYNNWQNDVSIRIIKNIIHNDLF